MERKTFIVVLLCLMGLMINVFKSEGQDIEFLIKQLGDENEDVRAIAVYALAQMGEAAKDAVPAL